MRRVYQSPGTTTSVALSTQLGVLDVSMAPIPLDQPTKIWIAATLINCTDTSAKLTLLQLATGLQYLDGQGNALGSISLPVDLGWGTSGPVAFPALTSSLRCVADFSHPLPIYNNDLLGGALLPGGAPGAFRITGSALVNNTDAGAAHSVKVSVQVMFEPFG